MLHARPKSSLFASLLLAGTLAACGGAGAPSPGAAGSPSEGATDAGSSGAGSAAQAATDAAPAADASSLGAPLEDPSRYYGVYASPDQPNRRWFVSEAKRPEWAEQAPEVPPGHLALGAMFGDVAPWALRTVSDTEFVQAEVPDGQPQPVAIVFELGPDGKAVAFRFTNQDDASFGRLERQGDLPEGWQ
jgi:hypothetical protein